ncbi:MAG TPA: sulfurtransferase-like selenium metabolism protein YedF [Spirochaetota bacterium]|nr:sulfurtransferase-like selenium metabolism protein YedF [Spirochaetota bacterium]
MSTVIDARGLSCPQPVINAKRALESDDSIVVIVDNRTAVENVSRMAASMGCAVDVDEKGDGIYLSIRRHSGGPPTSQAAPIGCGTGTASGPTVMAFASDTMGCGNDELGGVLMRSLVHTVGEADDKPDVMVFYNTGVKLAVTGSPVLDDLRLIASKGTRILVCGTCLKFFNLTESLAVGNVSNMYEIKELLFSAGRLVRP